MAGIDPFVEGKKVLLLGFGKEGQSAYRMLEEKKVYKELAIADQREAVSWLQESKITWITGPDYQKALDEYDVVLKSPGIVLERPIESYKCQILSQTEVFFRLFRNQIIGITGTKGKSTTTSLLYHILKSAGRKALIAGNIGIPAFDQIHEVEEDTIIVFELSCHQLEHMTVSPHIGILLNIHEEHLDHYGDMEHYVAAKERIYRNQETGDILICGSQCLPKKGTCPSRLIPVMDLGENTENKEAGYQEQYEKGSGKEAETVLSGSRIWRNGSCYFIPKEQIRLFGHHNYYDIAFVYEACKQKGIQDEEFTRGLETYQPLPHRLHFLGEQEGVKYYDDSISTICDTTIQALNTIKDAETVLIGGMDRGIDYKDLIAYLSESQVNHIILMEATGRRIYKEIKEGWPGFRHPERLVPASHLEDAVALAKQLTKPGMSCVLSPAAASYGIFQNFEERGQVFERLVFGSPVI